MPWDSQRFEVEEDIVRDDQRMLAFKTPEGKLGLVFTNRSRRPFTFHVNSAVMARYKGYRYTPSKRDLALPSQSTDSLTTTLPPFSIEFWVQD